MAARSFHCFLGSVVQERKRSRCTGGALHLRDEAPPGMWDPYRNAGDASGSSSAPTRCIKLDVLLSYIFHFMHSNRRAFLRSLLPSPACHRTRISHQTWSCAGCQEAPSCCFTVPKDFFHAHRNLLHPGDGTKGLFSSLV